MTYFCQIQSDYERFKNPTLSVDDRDRFSKVQNLNKFVKKIISNNLSLITPDFSESVRLQKISKSAENNNKL